MFITFHKFVQIEVQKFENDDNVLSKLKTIEILNNVFSTFIISIGLFILQRSQYFDFNISIVNIKLFIFS